MSSYSSKKNKSTKWNSPQDGHVHYTDAVAEASNNCDRSVLGLLLQIN